MPAKFQRNGVQYSNGYYVYWLVLDDDETVIKMFKDAANAADWSLRHGGKSVQMGLRAPFDPPVKTED